MNRYIDADAALKRFEEMHGNESELLNGYNADWIVSFIEAQPTADVQEVRHAQWYDTTPPRFYACSYCGGAGHGIYKFCPWCGAKMDGGESK